MTAAILMCDCMALSAPPGECPRKTRKHNFALNWGFCGLFPRKGEKTYNFIHVCGIPHIFPFGLKERGDEGMNHEAGNEA